MNGDAAVDGFEADGGTAGAEVGVDGVAVDFGLVGARDVEGDSSVDRAGDEVRGVGAGDGD